MLSIQLLGSVQITCDGDVMPLPSSRKTRALLTYIVLSDESQRRDALCELFWNRAHDPRGSLRWSLSKLRKCLGPEGASPLFADRERVHFNGQHAGVDVFDVRSVAYDDEAAMSTLEQAWSCAQKVLLRDCELPNQSGFMEWLRQERDELKRLRARIAGRATMMSQLTVHERMIWADRWLRDRPGDPAAAEMSISLRHELGLYEEASEIAKNSGRGDRRLSAPGHDRPAPQSRPPRSFSEKAGSAAENLPRQTVHFARAQDGVSLAWASVGDEDAAPLVKAANWLTHLELDWGAPIWSPLFRNLARDHRVIRYDERGCGLSDWDVPTLSFDTFVSDLEAVVDAAGLERFPLMGISQGAAVCIEYAVRHPERVSHLILFGGYPVGWRYIADAQEVQEREAVMLLVRNGWGRSDPVYRRLFSQTFMPDATLEELNWFDEFQRSTTSPENAVRFLEAFSLIDVRHRLKDVSVPTLILHSRGDRRIPLATGLELAAEIPGAEFIGLDSNNHLLIGRESASAKFVSAVRNFTRR